MSAVGAIYDLLLATSDVGDVLTGGVYKRTIKRKGEGSTPLAFTDTGQIKPSAVVKDRGDNADSTGLTNAYLGFPQVWLYAPTTESGRATIESAFAIIAQTLNGATIDPGDGSGAGLVVIGRLGVDDDPELSGSLVDMIRIQVDGLWGF